MTKPLIFDVFPFFNELDILELRLNILDPYVDFFVISEAVETFSGLEKPLYFLDNQDRFAKFLPKIIYNLVPEKTDVSLHPYQRDVFQKNSIAEVLKDHCTENDIIIWGDLDEVPNPEIIENLTDFYKDDVIHHFAQDNFMGYLNLQEVTGSIRAMTPDFDPDDFPRWLGTKLFSYKFLSNKTLTELRNYDDRSTNVRLSPGGWHWSYVGSDIQRPVEDRIYTKIVCAAHTELNNDQIKEQVKTLISNNQDPLGRSYAQYQVQALDYNFPEYLLENLDKYSYLIR